MNLLKHEALLGEMFPENDVTSRLVDRETQIAKQAVSLECHSMKIPRL